MATHPLHRDVSHLSTTLGVALPVQGFCEPQTPAVLVTLLVNKDFRLSRGESRVRVEA